MIKRYIVIKSDYLHSNITEVVIGCAMKVHRTLGRGFPENIYQRALAIELKSTTLKFAEEASCPVYYQEHLIGKRRVDFIVEDKVLLELKATSVFEASHLNQIINYLQAFNLPIGLLLNFGKDSLEFKRFTNNSFKH